MSGIFTVKANTKFAAAHALRDYPGDCARIHGHNWTIEAEVEATKLDKLGIALDFRQLENQLREVADVLEHQYLNEIPPFDEINPTAENIAKWFYTELKKIIDDENNKLMAVTLWETDRFNIRYTEK